MTGRTPEKPEHSPTDGVQGSGEQAVARCLLDMASATPVNEKLRRSLRDGLSSEPVEPAARRSRIVSRDITRLRPRLVLPMAAAGIVILILALALQPPTIATARSVEAIGSVELLRLTGYDGYLSASPAGDRVVVEKDEALWLMAKDGRLTPLLEPPPGSYARMPAVSPDGRRVAFSHGESGGVGISVINIDGTGLTQVTLPGSEPIYDLEPAWSPDGTRIAFTRQQLIGMRPVVTRDRVMIVGADGAGEPVEFAEGTHPTWSPAGDRIVYTRRTGDSGAETELVLAHVDRSQTVSLGQGSDPAWSPAGKFVAYVRTSPDSRVLRARADGTPWLVVQEWSREIWAVNVVSMERFHLTVSTPYPRFDLAEWQSEAEAAGPPATGQVVAVVEGDHNDWNPAWGKDGKSIVFIRAEQPTWSSAGGFAICQVTLKLK